MSKTERDSLAQGMSRTQYYLLIASVMLATLIQILDQTIANVALPHMQASLGATQDNISWVLTSYIIAQAVTIPITGWLTDRVGLRRVFLFSIIGFVTASMFCGIALNVEQMVLFRLLQGMAGAFLGPLSQTVILDLSTDRNRNQLMSIYGIGIMIGPIMGPIVGGSLTESFDWRWIFFINIPLGLISFAGLFMLLPKTARVRRPFDLFGFSLLALALGALQLMLDRGQQADWFNSWEIWIEAGVSVSAFWMLGVHLRTSSHPLYSREMFRDRNLVLGMFFFMIMGITFMGAMALLPILMQRIYGYPVVTTGLLLSARGVGIMCTLAITGKLLSKTDPRFVIFAGFVISALTYWQMAYWSLNNSSALIVMSGLVQGIGMGCLFLPVNILAYTTLDPKYRTDAVGLIYLARTIGSSIGISILMALLASSQQVSHAGIAAYITPERLGIDLGRLALPENMASVGMAIMDMEVQRQAAMIAFLNDFWLIAALLAIATPLAFIMRPLQKPKADGEPEYHPVVE